MRRASVGARIVRAPTLLAFLSLAALASTDRMVEPVHGAVVLQGLDMSWEKGATRLHALEAGVHAESKTLEANPSGEAKLSAAASTSGPTRASLRYGALSTERPIMRGTETLTLHGHRDKDPLKRQPGVSTRTVLVELPEGSPKSAVVWLSGLSLELDAQHPSGIALQAFGLTTSAPVPTINGARFELTATLESGEGASGAADPVDYDATLRVDWTLVPADPAAIQRLDWMPEEAITAPWPMSWTPPAGSAEVFGGLSGFAFALDDKAVGTRRTLSRLTADLAKSSFDAASGQWTGEFSLGLTNRLDSGKQAPVYGQGTVSLLALSGTDRRSYGLWTLPEGLQALKEPYPFIVR